MTLGALIGSLIDLLFWLLCGLCMFEIVFRPKRIHLLFRNEKQRELLYKNMDEFFPSKTFRLILKILFIAFPIVIFHQIIDLVSFLTK